MYTFDQRRLDKLAALREMGVNPYPNGFTVEHTLAQAREHIGDRDREDLEADETEFVVAGRVRFHRKMGKLGFASIQDATGELQILAQRDLLSPEQYTLFKKLDLGDWVWLRGRCARTRKGEPTLQIRELALYSKCIASMPDKMKGFQDPEQRQRMRYLDLAMNEDTREVFRIRSGVVREMRRFFDDRGFMEVETPMLQVIPGGAAARPFVTHHNALGIDLYMRIAPELFLKRLVVGGFERVYEINKNFRNEGISVKHNPEFTMLEFYWAHATFLDLMTLTEELVSGLAQSLLGTDQLPWGESTLDFSRPWRQARMDDLIAEAIGAGREQVWDVDYMRDRWLQAHPGDAAEGGDEDLPSTPGKWFEWFFDEYVESSLQNPTFVTHYPAEISPLSRKNEAEPRVTDRFELFAAGWEIANGFSELNDPVDQAERFTAQVAARDEGDDEAMLFDADYVRALSYGMPPTAGEGIGIDRLVMLLTNRHSIREVILFPTLRPQQS